MSDTDAKQDAISPQDDLLVEGFHRLDDNVVELNAPRLHESEVLRAKPVEARVRYWRRLAATMNHAAMLLQDQRNELSHHITQKEKQLEQMAAAVESNNQALQAEVTRMNEQRQSWNDEARRLNARIRELEGGDNS